MKTVVTDSNQTIYDIAVQHYGTVEAVGELLMNNPTLMNDQRALVLEGVDYLNDNGFYVDVALSPNQQIHIDNSSELMNHNITRAINKHITTYTEVATTQEVQKREQ